MRTDEPRFRSIDRWLTYCRQCGQRATYGGPHPPRSHACPAIGPEGRGGFHSIQRIEWRRPRAQERGNCREAEPRHVPALPEPKPGECGWGCRGSLSPICYCPGCKGQEHGTTQLIVEPLEDSGASSIMDQIIARTPEGEIPRKGRKST